MTVLEMAVAPQSIAEQQACEPPQTPEATSEQPSTPVPSGPPALTSFTGEELQRMHFRPTTWTIPELFPSGLVVLSAPPGARKSWVALHSALAVATGSNLLGEYPVNQGPCLVLSYEIEEADLQYRVSQLTQAQASPLGDIGFHTAFPPYSAGGWQQLQQQIKDDGVKFVVIDTLSCFLGDHRVPTSYHGEYSFYRAFRQFGRDNDCTIMLVTHDVKGKKGKGVDRLRGSSGIPAAADVWIGLEEASEDGAVVRVTFEGNNIKRVTHHLQFDPAAGGFQIVDGAQVAKERPLSPQRRAIRDYLASQPGTKFQPHQIAEVLGTKRHAMDVMLGRMKEAGQVQGANGYYWLEPDAETPSDDSDSLPVTAVTDHCDQEG